MRLAICFLALPCLPALAAPPVSIKSRPLSELAIHPQREASAQVVSLNLAKRASDLSARIEPIPVEPGQRIAKGAVVAQLDCADAKIAAQRTQAALASSQARLKLARLQLQRSTELAAQNFISGDALDAKKTEVAVVAAEVRVDTAARAAAQPLPRDRGSAAGAGERTGQPRHAHRAAVGYLAPAAVGTGADQRRQPAGAGPAGIRQPGTRVRGETAARVARGESCQPQPRGAIQLSAGRPCARQQRRTALARPAPLRAGGHLVKRAGQLGVFVVDTRRACFVPLPDAQEGRPAAASALPAEAALVTDGRFALQDGMTVTPR